MGDLGFGNCAEIVPPEERNEEDDVVSAQEVELFSDEEQEGRGRPTTTKESEALRKAKREQKDPRSATSKGNDSRTSRTGNGPVGASRHEDGPLET